MPGVVRIGLRAFRNCLPTRTLNGLDCRVASILASGSSHSQSNSVEGVLSDRPVALWNTHDVYCSLREALELRVDFFG